jgi:hypothetical protein
MQLRTITRLAAVFAVLFGVIGGVVTVLSPAGALEKERVVLDKAGETVVDYDPIIGNNPGANADASTTIQPELCQATGCDVVPLTIKQPAGVGENGDYFVQISLEWDTQEINGVPVLGTYDVDDLDLWIQNDPIVEDAGANQDGFTYYSAGTHMPEQVTMYKPSGDWNLLIVNAAGVNTGYRLRFKVIVDDIPGTIFESLPPQFRSGSFTPPTTAAPPPSFDVAPPPPVNIAPATPPAPDAAFTTPEGSGSSLDDQLAAPPLKFKPAAVSRPAPPSNLAILMWMIAFPLALLAVTGTLLLRRQRSLIAV